MDQAQLSRIRETHWRQGFGTLTLDELEVFDDVIGRHRPRSFVEIGTASGMTAGITCLLLAEHGGEHFVTVDFDNTFFGDPTKENGFLIPEIYPGGTVRVDRRPHTMSVDLVSGGEEFDMGFVDANHQHPWPLIDTLCLYPVMSGPKLLLHHDLNLYKLQPRARGIGPKYLFDQVPPPYRVRYDAHRGNLWSMSLDLPVSVMEQIAVDAFAMPWSITHRLQGDPLTKLRSVLDQHYSAELRAVFERSLEKFNRKPGEQPPDAQRAVR